MTLLITVFAALISGILWYVRPESKMMFGTLALMCFGASLMWLVDAVVEYIEVGAEYFTPAAADMLNDTYLGLSVAALGLVIWFAILCIKDPEGRVKGALLRK
ncbi:MAG: hypothetical protein LUG24_03380 [Clostridiales bacterium]|nr:hypothetical protein [Clostridiales bacterium]